jgi:hypothetical protein
VCIQPVTTLAFGIMNIYDLEHELEHELGREIEIGGRGK